LPLAGRCGVAIELRQPALHLGVALGERVAAPGWRTAGIDSLERPHDRSQVEGGLDRIDLGHRDGLTGHPRMDLPEPRIAATGPALGDGHRDLDGKHGSKPRQPLELLASRNRGPVAPWDADGELVAEPEDRVVGTARFDPS
jgi:hypothetical protein